VPDSTHGNKAIVNQQASKSESQPEMLPDRQPPLESLIRRARLNPQTLVPHQVLQLQRTIGNGATRRLLQPKPAAIVEHFAADHIQRKEDEALQKELGGEGYHIDRQYMVFSGTNSSGEAVGWKAHIGVAATAKREVIAKAMPVLRDKYNIGHKFDANIADTLDKFVTIYPPADEKTWSPLVKDLEAALSGVPVLIEHSTMAMGGGTVAMRHGQIEALVPEAVKRAGIEFAPIAPPDGFEAWNQYKPEFYAVNPEQITKEPDEQLAFIAGMGAMFLLKKTGRPVAAVIWKGKIRGDPRRDPNPFNIALPTGLDTTANLERILAVQENELDKLDVRVGLVVTHVDTLFKEGDALITSDNKFQIDTHNLKLNKEYQRITQYRGRLNHVEHAIRPIDFPALVGRVQTALLRVAALRDTLAKMTRQLDVSF
jgi:hypothetical protein